MKKIKFYFRYQFQFWHLLVPFFVFMLSAMIIHVSWLWHERFFNPAFYEHVEGDFGGLYLLTVLYGLIFSFLIIVTIKIKLGSQHLNK